MFFRTAYELLRAGKKIQLFGADYEYLWYDTCRETVVKHAKNGDDIDIPYSELNKYLEENSNRWELMN